MTPESEYRDPGEAGVGLLQFEELEYLCSVLSPEGCDELLQCPLIAAPRGGEAMLKVLEEELFCHATEELIGEQGTLTAPEE